MLKRELTDALSWRIKTTAALSRAFSVPAPGTFTAELTGAMKRKDEEAYRQFFELYFERLLRYLIVCTHGDEDIAREALQLTLIRIVRHIKPVQSEEQLWSWLTVLAHSALVDEKRKRRRQNEILDRIFRRELTEQAPSMETEASLIPALTYSLAELETEERQLIEAKYFNALSVRQLAIGTSEKAIESRLGRIRRKLKLAILNRLKRED
ncbi:MAG: polymerase sigma-70 factor, subfamily [Verrucomicrobiales bacterium]|nr:polymerase sigma-70 factor, subfamily [Verrucomicrobiales bacterium]